MTDYTFEKINLTEYEDFLSHQERLSLTQHPCYAKMKSNQKAAFDIFGVKNSDGTVLSAGIFQYWKYKRFFISAECIHGPIQDYANVDVFRFFLDSCIQTFKKQSKVIRLRISPLVEAMQYTDITPTTKNPIGEACQSILLDLGYEQSPLSFLEDPTLPFQYAYVKNIENLSFDDILASLTPTSRNKMKKALKCGIQVRTLTKDELPLFKDILDETKERTQMKVNAYPSFVDHIHDNYGSSAKFLLAYMDCDLVIEKSQKLIQEYEASLREIDERLLENPNSKKSKIKKNQTEEALKNEKILLNKTMDLKTKHGSVINMAASLFVYSNNELFYLSSGCYEAFMQYAPVHAMHYRMFEEAVEKQIKIYNFLAVSGDFSETAEDLGVLKYKRSFNGYVEQYIGTYIYKTRPFLYNLLKGMGHSQ